MLDAVLLLDRGDERLDVFDVLRLVALRNEEHVGPRRHDHLDIGLAVLGLERIDADELLRLAEIDRDERVAHEHARRVLLGGRDGILEVENDLVGAEEPRVEHEIGIIAGEIEACAPQPLAPRSAQRRRALGEKAARLLYLLQPPHGRLDPRLNDVVERPEILRDDLGVLHAELLERALDAPPDLVTEEVLHGALELDGDVLRSSFFLKMSTMSLFCSVLPTWVSFNSAMAHFHQR